MTGHWCGPWKDLLLYEVAWLSSKGAYPAWNSVAKLWMKSTRQPLGKAIKEGSRGTFYLEKDGGKFCMALAREVGRSSAQLSRIRVGWSPASFRNGHRGIVLGEWESLSGQPVFHWARWRGRIRGESHMEKGMGRNSCGVRMGMQRLVKVKGEGSPVSSNLASLTYKSSKTCFHWGLQCLHSKWFPTTWPCQGGQCLVTEYPWLSLLRLLH